MATSLRDGTAVSRRMDNNDQALNSILECKFCELTNSPFGKDAPASTRYENARSTARCLPTEMKKLLE